MSQGTISAKTDSSSKNQGAAVSQRNNPVGGASQLGRPSAGEMRENFYNTTYQSNANNFHSDQVQWSQELMEGNKSSSDQWMTSVDKFASNLNEG